MQSVQLENIINFATVNIHFYIKVQHSFRTKMQVYNLRMI